MAHGFTTHSHLVRASMSGIGECLFFMGELEVVIFLSKISTVVSMPTHSTRLLYRMGPDSYTRILEAIYLCSSRLTPTVVWSDLSSLALPADIGKVALIREVREHLRISGPCRQNIDCE